MNSYQCASMLEDKGCVYGNLFSFPTYVSQKASVDPIVGAKVTLMKASLAAYCAEMNESFWNSPEMQKFIKEKEVEQPVPKRKGQ